MSDRISNNVNTEFLLNQINQGIAININDISLPNPTEYMISLQEKYRFPPSAFSDILGLSRQHLCSYFNLSIKEKKTEPTRIQLIMMLVIMGATIEETQNALKYYIVKELYPKSKRDYFILTYIKNNPICIDTLPENKKERYSLGMQRLTNLNLFLNNENLPPLNVNE